VFKESVNQPAFDCHHGIIPGWIKYLRLANLINIPDLLSSGNRPWIYFTTICDLAALKIHKILYLQPNDLTNSRTFQTIEMTFVTFVDTLLDCSAVGSRQ
jgi:hypothetical protein